MRPVTSASIRCAQRGDQADRSDSARLHELEQLVERARGALRRIGNGTCCAKRPLFGDRRVSRLEAERQHFRGHPQAPRGPAAATRRPIERHWASRSGGCARKRNAGPGCTNTPALRVAQAEARHEAAGRLPDVEEALRQAETGANAARRELAQTEQQLRVGKPAQQCRRALDALDGPANAGSNRRPGGPSMGPDPATLAEREKRALSASRSWSKCSARVSSSSRRHFRMPTRASAGARRRAQAQRHSTELRARHDALVQLQNKIQNQGPTGGMARTPRSGPPVAALARTVG